MIMSWSRSATSGLGFLLLIAILFINALFDFLIFLVEEYPYIFVIVIACVTLIVYKAVSLKWGHTTSENNQKKGGFKRHKTRKESPWRKLVGRKDIQINGLVRNIILKKKPNQPDRFYVHWDGRTILLNVWKKQQHFSVEKNKRYIFFNIFCRINKYNNKIEFHYDPEYYGSYYKEWPRKQKQQRQKNQYQKPSQTPLQDLLKEFGCSASATVKEVRLRKIYWNQVLHPDFNINKPERLRKQMEKELKKKNELYDRIINLMKKKN